MQYTPLLLLLAFGLVQGTAALSVSANVTVNVTKDTVLSLFDEIERYVNSLNASALNISKDFKSNFTTWVNKTKWDVSAANTTGQLKAKLQTVEEESEWWISELSSSNSDVVTAIIALLKSLSATLQSIINIIGTTVSGTVGTVANVVDTVAGVVDTVVGNALSKLPLSLWIG